MLDEAWAVVLHVECPNLPPILAAKIKALREKCEDAEHQRQCRLRTATTESPYRNAR